MLIRGALLMHQGVICAPVALNRQQGKALQRLTGKLLAGERGGEQAVGGGIGKGVHDPAAQ